MGSGKWWLVARFASVPLNRVEQGSLLTADIGPGTVAQLDVKSPTRSGDVVAKQASLSRRVDGSRQAKGGGRVLAPDIQPSRLGAYSQASDGHRFDDGEGIPFHQDPVLEGTRLRLISVANQVMGPPFLVGDCPPFDSGWECCPTAS